MPAPILTTKLYIPPPRPNVVDRPRLIERLNAGLGSKLTLISAPAGFGKTTLLSEWAGNLRRSASDDPKLDQAKATKIVNRVAWLSLDEGENDAAGFLVYLIAALQTVATGIGERALGALQSPQPPPPEAVLTALLNEITGLSQNFVLVLDDYHVIDAKPVDQALAFLLEHQPPQMHLVIATREDPDLPLARYRGRGQLTELRAADLRFTPAEADEFLNQAMGLSLPSEDVAALGARTEGWIAGLQLAALSMQGKQDAHAFIQSFTGSHHFVMDYLVEEVLGRQSENVQTFLLRTSILNRMCGPLCDAVLQDGSASGQAALEFLEQTNLFIVPLDSERRWYRYHHLFADLLRQRLQQNAAPEVAELNRRASQWYEDNGLELEAFQHAAAANDVERAERLIQGNTIPLHYRGAIMVILDWLGSLPTSVLDARPWLWWRYASFQLIGGQTAGVEEKLGAAEAGLPGPDADEQSRDLHGHIAAARATLALTRYDVPNMIAQSRRALELLSPDGLFSRSTAYWTLGYAYILVGDRVAARQALTEGISLSQASGAVFFNILSTIGLGNVQELDNELHQAAETYRRVLSVAGDQPLQIINEAHLGLARVLYEWNDLEAAEQHGEQSLQLARGYDVRIIDRAVICEVLLARVKLARGDVDGAASMLALTEGSVRQQNFVHRMAEVAAAQVQVLIRQGELAAAGELAEKHTLPFSRARVHLAQGDASAALALLEPLRQQMESKGWHDERLKIIILQALAHHAQGEEDRALGEALALAEPGGFIRIFLDEGNPMAELLAKINPESATLSGYVRKLRAAFEQEKDAPARIPAPPTGTSQDMPSSAADSGLAEPLSERERNVLQLLAKGLSNREISERLFLALDTVKGHNRNIFGKLGVRSRTEAVARARELGLL